ncbi:MAG: hypothetical protein LBI66_07955 [Burkholderiaceae bacterium]|jgi:hypothetical protein|nr:hypothetical protein [Burkholderiaceae bacterium]
MHDFNATYDSALIRRADVVKRQGPGTVDYKYQKAAPVKGGDVKPTDAKAVANHVDLSEALRTVGERRAAHA